MRHTVSVGANLLAMVLLAFSCDAAIGQAAAGVKASASGNTYKVVRSISGAAGHEENGRYIMDEPRSVFVVGKDTKVTVYFEWEGPVGPHHFEGLWKSPEGKIVLISDFRYEAKGPRFSGYWSMLLSDATPSGEWNLETRIDGEPAGVHSFVLTGSSVAAAASTTPRLLSSAELYQKALDASVTIDKLAADGSILGKGTGFWVGDAGILTAFDVIDGASSLRVYLRDGSQVSTDRITAWNRWQDWALLKVDAASKGSLKPGPKDPLKVGDRCVFLDVLPAGAKLVDGSVTGRNAFPKAGERLLLASGVTPASYGGPLLDEYGNYVGVVGGSIIPGGDPGKIFTLLSDPGTLRTGNWEITGMAVPMNLLPDASASGSFVRLAELASRGEFLDPVMENKAIQWATLASMLGKDPGNMPTPADYKRVFRHGDTKAFVYITWRPYTKEKVNSILRWFNADNKLISESKPREMSLAPGKYFTTTWDIPIIAMPVGIYRIDLVLNDKTAWREFFRIAE